MKCSACRLITERSKEVIQASQPGTPHNLSRPVSMPELLIDLPGEQEPLLSGDDECVFASGHICPSVNLFYPDKRLLSRSFAPQADPLRVPETSVAVPSRHMTSAEHIFRRIHAKPSVSPTECCRSGSWLACLCAVLTL